MKKLSNQFAVVVGLTVLWFLPVAALAQCEVGRENILRMVAPIYPEVALAAGAKGAVNIDAHVDSSGSVTDVKSVGRIRLLAAAAEASAKLWKFDQTDKCSSNRSVRLAFSFEISNDVELTGPVFTINPSILVEIRGTRPKIRDVRSYR